MLARAISKYVRYSPQKLRSIADCIRGKSVDRAVAWLKAYSSQRTIPLLKTLNSACANARNLDSGRTSMDGVYVGEICVDNGPVVRYFKPGSRGRGQPQTKRMSHIAITLKEKK
jgi:large subunit ribosomal protein L22